MFYVVKSFLGGFSPGSVRRELWRKEKKMRNHLDESQIDSMICESFPCSDPPSTY